MSDTKIMAEMPIRKLLIKQSIPAALGILVLSVYALIDTLFIGRYVGGAGIAAITIIAPISFLVSSIGLGIGMGGASLISIALGQNNKDRAKKIFGNQITITVLIGLLLTVLGFIFYDSILIAFGASKQMLPYAQEYFFYTLVGTPFYIFQLMINNVFRSEGRAREAMLLLGIPAIINIALDAWMIIGLDMGLEGAALATAISQFIGVAIGGIMYGIKSSEFQPSLSDLRPSIPVIREISALGSVTFLAQGSGSIVILVANHMFFQYGGDLAISAYGLGIRLMMFAFFPVIGIVQGFMPIAGYNYGSKQMARVKEVIRLSFIYATVIALLILVSLLLATENTVQLFTTEKSLIALAIVAVTYMFSAYPLLGIQQISIAFFQATGQAKAALWLTLSKQFILIPSMFIFPLWFGLDGLWYTFPFSEVLGTIIAFIMFKIEWRKIAVQYP
jgi:putative MATE family efflux protein